MGQRKIILMYLASMVVVWGTLGGYIACGAQSYRVAVDGDVDNRPPQIIPGNQTQGVNGIAGQSSATSLTGVHSVHGWAQNLPVRFKTSAGIDAKTVKLLRDAMGTWEAAVGKTLFAYDGIEARTGADFDSLFKPLDDMVNGHYFDSAWKLHTGKSNSVLATTLWENDPRDPTVIVKADIRYNSEYYIFGDSLKDYSQGKRVIVDMESLALHELGHLIGLTHLSQEEDRFSVMNPSLFIGEGMITRRLSEGDIARVRSIYGVGDVSQAEKLEKSDNFPVQQ